MVLDQPDRKPHEVAFVAGAEVAHHAVVRLEDRRELTLARTRLLLGPGGEFRCVDQLRLEPVDAAHEAPEQRARIAAEVVMLERQLIYPFGQHRQAVAGAERRVEQVVPAARAAQHRSGELRRGYNEQFAVAIVQLLLQRCAGGVSACGGG